MPSIFLSSTFVDLVGIRKNLSRWLSQVFGADLIIMETFGSDAVPPDINSVRKVRDCDIFIGIYAHRYGTLDPTTGKSITELELDEAQLAHSGGVVRDILLYLHDEKAPWPEEFKDSSAADKSKLTRLRNRAKSHTPSYFESADDLLLAITRDVYRKLIEHFHSAPLQIRDIALPGVVKLAQPVGMEFLGSNQRPYLIGRSAKIAELVKGIEENRLLLLLGDSGVGKTSLINAGLIPELLERAWRPVYVRPLGLPASDVVHQVQASLFKGRPAYRGPLVPFLIELSELIQERRLVVIIDQFEDVLVARSQDEVEKLVEDLKTLHHSPPERIRVLVSYRADLEGRLGRYWQMISGSAAGLPRAYLEGLSEDGVREGILRAAEDLDVRVEIDDTGWKGIERDLGLASEALGLKTVYPPHVQMLIEHIWTSTEKGKRPYGITLYRTARGVDGIVGDYLGRQLEYADDTEGHVRLVLIALVRSYGVKAQKRVDELASDTGIDQEQIEIALEKLIDLRLVRHIEPYYEVSHDFIARRVMSELVDSEEKEVKRFQELLNSKGSAFATTGALLTSQEMLMLYKHRERVVPGETELRLLLVSWLKGNGPALYWLLNLEARSNILSWLASELSKERTGSEQAAAAVLLRLTLEGRPISEDDFAALRRYKSAIELASLMQRDSATLPDSMILAGLRHRREEVRRVSKKVTGRRFIEGKWSLLQKISNSTSKYLQETYREMVIDPDVPAPPSDGSRVIEEFRALKMIKSGGSESAVEDTLVRLKQMRPSNRSRLLGEGLVAVRRGQIDKLLKMVKSRPRKEVGVMLGALAGSLAANDFNALLATYEAWNKRELDERIAPAVYGKAEALAGAVARTTRPELMAALRATIKRIRITYSARTLVLALLSHGRTQDVALVLQRVADNESRIEFRNHTELGRETARRMAEIAGTIPDFLRAILNKREFWEHRADGELSSEDLLPLHSAINRPLYVRLAAYATIGAAGEKDAESLLGLAMHPFGLIARAAVIRLIHILKAKAFNQLMNAMTVDMPERKAESFAAAIRDAEIEYYGIANVW
jgi:hypothetical protein